MRRVFKNQGIGKLSVRSRYYYEQHRIRWERRFKKKLVQIEGVMGTFDGIRWLDG